MFKSILFVFFFLALGVFNISAQNQSNSNPQTVLPNDTQWEYLVVSISQSESENPIQNLQPTKMKTEGSAFGYERDGKIYYADTFNFIRIQAALDSFGKRGWDLVGVIPPPIKDGGSSENDARLIFKRKFDAERARSEAAELEAKNKLTKPEAKKPIEFVELDQADRLAAQKEVESQAKARLEQALKNVKNVKITDVKVSARRKREDSAPVTQATVVVDGSQFLLKDGNRYRQSEAQQYAKQVAASIAEQIGLRKPDNVGESFVLYSGFNAYDAPVRIQVQVRLFSNNESVEVARGTLYANYMQVARKE